MTKSVFLPQAAIDAVFDNAKTQGDYILGIIRLVHPDFDEIAEFNGFIAASPTLWEYIDQKAILFDQLHHPGVIAGGAWMNYGFATEKSENLMAWEVLPAVVTYKNNAR